MKKLLSSLALCAVALLAAPVHAATLGVFTKDYGIGQDAPLSGGTLGNDFVQIDEVGGGGFFFDTFDFSSLVYDTIDTITLTLDFDRAGPRTFGNGGLREAWDLNIQGSQIGPTFDNFIERLDDSQAPQDFVLSAASDVGGVDSFQTALANQGFVFWFTEPGNFGLDNFRLFSATLTVAGTPAVVPLPAPVLLLLTGLLGLTVMRRRQMRRAGAVA